MDKGKKDVINNSSYENKKKNVKNIFDRKWM